MKRIHPSTTLAVVLNIAAISFAFTGYILPAVLLALAAYFAAIKEVARYTSWYQFVTVFASAIISGLAIELPLHHFPYILLSLVFAAACSVLRMAFFRIFSYTAYAWLEPTAFIFSLCFYAYGNFSKAYDWKAVALPLPILIFAGILGWGIVKDKKQLMLHSGAYQMQTGKPASLFELPDQDGNPVRLADFFNQRHVLLIFVRGDWCPGCHMMLRAYEKNNKAFQEKNVYVLAIGPDPVGVNKAMVEKLGLEFKVLFDEGQHTAMKYGVQLKEYEHDFSETYQEGIPLPASFLIDKKGIVQYVSRPDRVGEFLNPSLIFPILEKLS